MMKKPTAKERASSMSGFLHRYFLNNATNRAHKWIHYFDIYERHFERFRGSSPTVIEIGVRGGGSLKMWKEYFGAGSRIVGIDIDPECKQYEEEGIEIFIGSQDDEALLAKMLATYPNPDVLVDDGSHVMRHMIATFATVYPKMSPHGVYLVEDAHTCYNPSYDGGLKKEGSFMEFVKDKIDDLHAARSKGTLQISDFTRSTDAICCYDGVIVFERRPQAVRQTVITDKMPGEVRGSGRSKRSQRAPAVGSSDVL